MKSPTIRGIKFYIDDDNIASSSEGSLGHIADCEKLAELFQSLFEIADTISL